MNGVFLKALLNKHGVTIYRLCKDTHLSYGVMNEFINGKRKSISVNTALIISQYLNVSLDELVGRKR